jgi:hypothetical protein
MRKSTLVLAVVLVSMPASADVRRCGVQLDAGVPDGANGSLVYRPWSFLRLHAGGGHNLMAAGVRMGLDLLPLGAGTTISVDAGHYFSGDANELVRLVTGDSSMNIGALRNVGYDYANFHLGFEVGEKYVTFYLRGGVSFVKGVIKDPGSSQIDAYTDITFNGDPRVSAWAPSAKAGLIVYFAR